MRRLILIFALVGLAVSWLVSAQVPVNYPAGTLHAPAEVARTQASGNIVLTAASAHYQFIDPNGSDRDVTLPTAATGMAFVIKNYAAANTLTVKDAAAATVTTVVAGDAATVIYDGVAWQVL